MHSEFFGDGRSDERDRLRVEAVEQCDGEAETNNTQRRAFIGLSSMID
jgi:hypothetical protein